MKMKKKYLIKVMALVFLLEAAAGATPSTQIWNPSTDVRPAGSVHLDIDNYFTLQGPASGGYAFPADIGLTCGVLPGLEVGIDILLPQTDPFMFNAKYGLPESVSMPAIAIGGYGFGTRAGVTDQNIIYALAAKTVPFGRLSAGYLSGNEKVLLDPSGNKSNSGLILTWDKQLTDKLWACIDYAGSNSLIGALFAGGSYSFSPNVSVIFAYGTFNNGSKPVVTTQVDINL